MAMKTVENGLFKPELWSKELVRRLDDSGVMKDCVNTKYEGEIKQQGDTVHIQKIGAITVSDYTKGTALSYQKLDGDTQELVVDQKKYFAFEVSDIDKVQANIEYMGKYLDEAKKEIVRVKDTFLLSKSADVPASNQLGEIILTKANAYDTLVDLYTLLCDSNAIDSNGKGADGKAPWLVLNPKILAMIKKDDRVIHATSMGDTTLRKGAIANIAGFDIKVSTNMKPVITGSGESAVSKTTVLAGTTEAITYASQITKIKSTTDKDDPFVENIAGLYVYGAKTIQPEALASAVITLG